MTSYISGTYYWLLTYVEALEVRFKHDINCFIFTYINWYNHGFKYKYFFYRSKKSSFLSRSMLDKKDKKANSIDEESFSDDILKG